jgi:hypothetical protein
MARTEMNKEYFSGSQASIFIGEIWVDDILDWQCSVGANAMPIYGYGSTFYDHACQGQVLVKGSFTVNFREPNYLFAVLARNRKYIYNDLNLKGGLIGGPYDPIQPIKELGFQDKRQALDDFFDLPNPKNNKNGPVYDTITGSNGIQSLVSRDENDFAIPTFDIKIGYGTQINENTIGEQILGVKLVGKGKVIMSNGEPIKESYSFFARNVI